MQVFPIKYIPLSLSAVTGFAFMILTVNLRTEFDSIYSSIGEIVSLDTPKALKGGGGGVYDQPIISIDLQTNYGRSDKKYGRLGFREQVEKKRRRNNQVPSEDVNVLPSAELRPVFQCNDAIRWNKFVFVHVFKTAGSTLRAFFRAYAQRCHAGWATIVECNQANAYSVGKGSEIWTNGRQETDCVLKDTVLRTGAQHFSGEVIPRTEVKIEPDNNFIAREMDMFGGHLPLGVGSVYGTKGGPDEERATLDYVHYLAFFRNSADTFVSSVLQVNKALAKKQKTEKIIAIVQERVHRNLGEGKFRQRYKDYLITPQQRNETTEPRKQQNHSPRKPNMVEDETVQVMMNLLQFRVTVGITERMSQSLELIERQIDSDGAVTDLFTEFGMTRASSNRANDLPSTSKTNGASSSSSVSQNDNDKAAAAAAARNVSPISTSALIKTLMSDKPFFSSMLEYVKYEQQITDFALALHFKQYETNIALSS